MCDSVEFTSIIVPPHSFMIAPPWCNDHPSVSVRPVTDSVISLAMNITRLSPAASIVRPPIDDASKVTE